MESNDISYKDVIFLINDNIKNLDIKIDRLHDKTDIIDTKVNDVKIQATKTNGKVVKLESETKDHCKKIQILDVRDRTQQSWIDKKEGKALAYTGIVAGVVTFLTAVVYLFIEVI